MQNSLRIIQEQFLKSYGIKKGVKRYFHSLFNDKVACHCSWIQTNLRSPNPYLHLMICGNIVLFWQGFYIHISRYNTLKFMIRILFTSLFQNVTYYSFRGRFSESSILVTVHKGGVAPRGKQTWQKELLSIPTVAPSHLRGCKIIDIQYCLEVRLFWFSVKMHFFFLPDSVCIFLSWPHNHDTATKMII